MGYCPLSTGPMKRSGLGVTIKRTKPDLGIWRFGPSRRLCKSKPKNSEFQRKKRMSGGGEDAGSGRNDDQNNQWVKDLQRTVTESKDNAIRSALSLQQASSSHLRSLQDNLPHAVSQIKTGEQAFFSKVKDQLMVAKDNPAATLGVAATAAFLLMPGPRRFLFRHTLGRLQSEEAQFLRAEKNVKEFSISVDLMKKESRKLLERASLAENDMNHGRSHLLDSGRQLQRLAKSVYKVETQAADLMDGLREIPGREALKLRAEVASMLSHLKQQRAVVNKRVMRISELGLPV